jgi:hypothetical protein
MLNLGDIDAREQSHRGCGQATVLASWRVDLLGKLLCHRSNFEQVPLRRIAILTPQRLERASRSKRGLWTTVFAAARPGLLGTLGCAHRDEPIKPRLARNVHKGMA